MAAIAYLLLPLTGSLAYFTGKTWRARFHGLQAIALGLAWPLALYAATALGPPVVAGVVLLGAAAWLTLLIGAAVGRDPALPGLGRILARAAERPPGDS